MKNYYKLSHTRSHSNMRPFNAYYSIKVTNSSFTNFKKKKQQQQLQIITNGAQTKTRTNKTLYNFWKFTFNRITLPTMAKKKQWTKQQPLLTSGWTVYFVELVYSNCYEQKHKNKKNEKSRKTHIKYQHMKWETKSYYIEILNSMSQETLQSRNIIRICLWTFEHCILYEKKARENELIEAPTIHSFEWRSFFCVCFVLFFFFFLLFLTIAVHFRKNFATRKISLGMCLYLSVYELRYVIYRPFTILRNGFYFRPLCLQFVHKVFFFLSFCFSLIRWFVSSDFQLCAKAKKKNECVQCVDCFAWIHMSKCVHSLTLTKNTYHTICLLTLSFSS